MLKITAINPETLSDAQEILSRTSILWAAPSINVLADGQDHYIVCLLEDEAKEVISIEMAERNIRAKWLN